MGERLLQLWYISLRLPLLSLNSCGLGHIYRPGRYVIRAMGVPFELGLLFAHLALLHGNFLSNVSHRY